MKENLLHVIAEGGSECNYWIKQQLINLSEPKFQEFTSRLLPGIQNIQGVRLPHLRKIAKQLAKGDWRAYLMNALDDSYEEIMLQGMVIGYVDEEWRDLTPYIETFLSKIDNWSTCDSFCSGLKLCRKNQEEVWRFLQPLFISHDEFVVRFAIVILINYYQEEKYIDLACNLFDTVIHPGYYVKMAVAWAVSIYYIHFPEEVMEYLRQNKLDEFTYKKSLQKICESRAVNNEEKEKIRKLLNT